MADAVDSALADGPAVVVVTHRRDRSDVDRCLASIRRAGGVGVVVVVDNSGLDRPFPDADRIVTCANEGYGAAFNRGWRVLDDDESAEGVVALNDDTTVTTGWIAPLADALAADDHVGAAQPLIVAADGTDTVLSAGVELDRWFAGSDIGRGDGVASFERSRDISIFTGGAVLFRATYLRQLGGFDERYFLYYEDVDLALRGVERGWRHRLVPHATVRHAGGASVAELADDVRRIQETSRLRCAARHGTMRWALLACSLSFRRLRHRPFRAHLAGFVAGVATLPIGRWERRVARPADQRGLARLGRRIRVAIIRRRRPRTAGVNVLGPHRAPSGLGEVTRSLTHVLRLGGLDAVEIDVERPTSPPWATRLHATTISTVPALQLQRVLELFPEVASATDRHIGYWFWELAEVPDTHVGAMRSVDEIWAPNGFVADAYSSVGLDRAPPVIEVPLPPPRPTIDDAATTRWRERLIGDDEALVVASLDLLSVVERKNPIGAIEAFRRAMHRPGVPRARLVVKTINGDRRPDDLRRIHDVATAASIDLGRPAVEVIDETVHASDLDAMVAAADCFLSLHRAEGLGLHLTTAMFVGTPVIATGWSGSLTHAHEGTAAVVDYDLIPVVDGRGAYPDSARWADPDLDEAASAIARLLTEPDVAERLAATARAHVQGLPGDSTVAGSIVDLLSLDRPAHARYAVRS